MIRVSVMYPYAADAHFDHDYYRDTHMPLVQSLLGDSCIAYAIDKGLAGAEPGSTPAYIAICHIFSSSAEVFQRGMQEHGAGILADIANFTDITAVIQTSQVVVERSRPALNPPAPAIQE